MPTNIVFGATSDGRTSVRVNEDFVMVARALREGNWIEFTDTKGRPVVVNAQNVLYAEDSPRSGSRAAGFS